VKHGGWLEAFPGPGGRLCLTIPAIIETPGVSETVTSAAMGGTGRLLVMDDDLQVLETIKEMLEALDYDVETASDGGQALHMIAEAYRIGRPYDLLILDLVVPGGIGGLETLSRARSRFGDVRAVVSSGYSSDSVLSEFGVHGFKAALRKPFNLEELSSTVRRLINIPEGGSRHDDRGRM
jgi:CheY-like chemotaxis protein